MSDNEVLQGLDPREKVFRDEMRAPLMELVSLLSGEERALWPHWSYEALLQRAHHLIAAEIERTAPNEPTP